MLIRALAVASLLAVPPEKEPQPKPADEKALCLKRCAGEAKHADGKHLLACLSQCEPPKPPPVTSRGD